MGKYIASGTLKLNAQKLCMHKEKNLGWWNYRLSLVIKVMIIQIFFILSFCEYRNFL